MGPNSREFWIRYLAEGTDFAAIPTLARERSKIRTRSPLLVRIEYPTRYALEIEINGGHQLQLVDLESGCSTVLGWMDSHQNSDAFRYDELNDVCSATTTRPLWQVRTLLSQYVAPLPETIEVLVATLEEALRESQLFDDDEAKGIAAYMRQVVRPDFQWVEDPELGWIGVAKAVESSRYPEFYTLRFDGNKEMDFQLVREFLAYCRDVRAGST